MTLTYPHFPAWILWVCSWGPFNSKQSCFYRRVWDWHVYVSRGFLQDKFHFSFADAIISMEMVQFSFPCEIYPAQSLRIHSSFHNTPSLHWYIKEDICLEDIYIYMFYFKVLSTYSTSNTFSAGLFILFNNLDNIKWRDAHFFHPHYLMYVWRIVQEQ